ncbi:MAG: type II toxin-antitoxin system prevent-host-death family antitoxin [Paracoccaceae bacterium]
MKTFPISAMPSQLDGLLDIAELEPVLLTQNNEPEFALLTLELYEKLKRRKEEHLSK